MTTQAAPPPGSTAPTSDTTRAILRFIGKYGTLLFLLGMIIVFSALRPNVFPTANNLLLVLNSIALVAIISGGLTLVLVVGEFDLSIGSLASLAGIIGVSFDRLAGPAGAPCAAWLPWASGHWSASSTPPS